MNMWKMYTIVLIDHLFVSLRSFSLLKNNILKYIKAEVIKNMTIDFNDLMDKYIFLLKNIS